MKLLINTPLVSEPIDADFRTELAYELKEYSIRFTDQVTTFTILEQKCCLDEIAMNKLFYYTLLHFPHNLEYAGLGGAGCELSLTVTQGLL